MAKNKVILCEFKRHVLSQKIFKEGSMENYGEILIVENDKQHIKVLKEMLSHLSTTCVVAQTGFDALYRLSQDEEIYVVIVNADMPKIDNFKIVDWIKKFNPKIKIIIFSSKAVTDLSFYACNPAAVLKKPFSFQQLKTALGIPALFDIKSHQLQEKNA